MYIQLVSIFLCRCSYKLCYTDARIFWPTNEVAVRKDPKEYRYPFSGSVRNWTHITDQIGMFCFTGMTPAQVRAFFDLKNITRTKNTPEMIN
jgi:hypothetical protein